MPADLKKHPGNKFPFQFLLIRLRYEEEGMEKEKGKGKKRKNAERQRETLLRGKGEVRPQSFRKCHLI